MGYKLNVRGASNWENLLKDTNIEVTDNSSNFVSTSLDGVLDELFNGAGGLEWSTITSDTTATSKQGFFVDTSSGNPVTITLPATASMGDYIDVVDYEGTFFTTNCTIDRNGHNIMGLAEDFIANRDNLGFKLVYVDTTQGWRLVYTSDGNSGGIATNKLYLDAINKVVDGLTDVKDVFIYDTSQDSDGGAWRKRCQHTTWYNEAESVYRSTTKEFPALALIVVSVFGGYGEFGIYDLTDPDVPMWKRMFSSSSVTNGLVIWGNGTDPSACAMKNGVLLVGGNYPTRIDFVKDEVKFYGYINGPFYWNGEIGSTVGSSWTERPDANDRIPLYGINDIDVTIHPDAPIDEKTGLPVPTFAIATDAGIGIIDGPAGQNTIVDMTWTPAGTNETSNVSFSDDGSISWLVRGTTAGYVYLIAYNEIPSANVATAADRSYTNFNNTINCSKVQLNGGENLIGYEDASIFTDDLLISGSRDNGISLIKENKLNDDNGMVAYITDSYNTGWIYGDPSIATLSDTTSGAFTAVIPDRSVKDITFNVVGQIDATVVDTGADIVGFEANTQTSRITTPSASPPDVNYQGNDFYFMCWIKHTPVNGIVQWHSIISGDSYGDFVGFSSASDDDIISLQTNHAGGVSTITGTTSMTGRWAFVVGIRNGTSLEYYVDGKLEGDLTIGTTTYTMNKIEAFNLDGNSGPSQAVISLLRTGKGALTAEEIKYIYETERKLFRPNAKAVITNNDITDISYDRYTNSIYVASGNDIDVLQGLRVVSSDTKDADLVSIDSVRGRTVSASTSGAYVYVPQINLREEFEDDDTIETLIAGDGIKIDATNHRKPIISSTAADIYVRGDGVDNGSVIITADDKDFVVKDTTDTTQAYIYRDHSESKLFLGSDAAVITARSHIIPNATGTFNLGDSGVRFNAGFFGTLDVNIIYPSQGYTRMYGSFLPYSDSAYDLGATDRKWAEIHGDAIYQGGNAVLDSSTGVYGDGTENGAVSIKASNVDTVMQDGTIAFLWRDYSESALYLGHNTVAKIYPRADMIPNVTSSYDLGSSGATWAEIHGDAIYQGGNAVLDTTSTAANSQLLDNLDSTQFVRTDLASQSISYNGNINLTIRTTSTAQASSALIIGGNANDAAYASISSILFNNYDNTPYIMARIDAQDPYGDYTQGGGRLVLSTYAGGTQNVGMTMEQDGWLGIHKGILMTDNISVCLDDVSRHNKILFWGKTDGYGIGMKAAQTFGHINDYAISFSMDDISGTYPNRGFVWRKHSHTDAQGLMSLNMDGRLTILDDLTMGATQDVTIQYNSTDDAIDFIFN